MGRCWYFHASLTYRVSILDVILLIFIECLFYLFAIRGAGADALRTLLLLYVVGMLMVGRAASVGMFVIV